MTKRFGRNQKRKMRKQIEELESGVQSKQREVEYHQNLTARVRSFLRNIDNLECVEEIRANPEMARSCGYETCGMDDSFSVSYQSSDMMELTCKIERLHPLVLDSIDDKLRNVKRYMFSWNGERYGFDASREYFEMTPPEFVESDIARQCARMMADKRNKNKRGY